MVVVTPEDIKHQLAHKDDDRTASLYAAAISMIVLPTIAVALRLACRRHLKAPISHDDIAICVALVSPALALRSHGIDVAAGAVLGLKLDAHPLYASGDSPRTLMLQWSRLTIKGAHYGSGRHTILSPIPDVVHFVQMEYAIELTYCVLITTTKFSILLFYRRVFINSTTVLSFRIAWYCITAFAFLWGISTFFAAAFQCTPASFYWTQVTMKTKGTCVDLSTLLLVTAITNIVTDVAILVLPMPVVWNLHIQRSQKVAVTGIFLLGSFVCIASIIRAHYLHRVVSPDPQWTAVDAGFWSVIEPGVGIVCACLPLMGPILRRMFPLPSLNRSGGDARKISVPLVATTSGTTQHSNPEKCQPSVSSTERMNGSVGCRPSTAGSSVHKPSVNPTDFINNKSGSSMKVNVVQSHSPYDREVEALPAVTARDEFLTRGFRRNEP
ncbi:MAG: hypothetical protein Q9222_001708 [Ikaeria aurantiellina]